MEEKKMLELIKDTFELQSIAPTVHNSKTLGIFSNKQTRFYIPGENLKRVYEDFPFIKNAVKAHLIEKDASGKFYITADALQVRKTDERKKGSKQFFSIEGNDPHERTTIYDALHSICNVRKVTKAMNLSPKQVKFSVEHEDGNIDKVLNYIEMDSSNFGANEDEIKKNVDLFNKNVKFKKGN